MTLWFLRLLGAPRDPDENMAWQYRHPARVAFALATLMSSFFSAWLLAATENLRIAIMFFVGFFAFMFVLGYVAARINIARGRRKGDATSGGVA